MDATETSAKVKGEAAAIKKILSDEEGQKLRALSRTITKTFSREELISLAQIITTTNTNVAFLLIQHDEKQFKFLFTVSTCHLTIGSQVPETLTQLCLLVAAVPQIYLRETTPVTNQLLKVDLAPCSLYFERNVTDADYVPKILDTVNAIIFGYLKKNKLIPEEEDEEDKFADLDNMEF
jgi:hypothetical protein